MAFVWEQRKLGEVADIVGGGTPSTNVSNYWDGNIDWYAPAEISDQIFLSSSQRKITEKGYNNSSAKMLPIGTVLFTSRAGIGKTAILSKKGCTNQGFQSIVPHKDELDSYFIFSRTDELKRYGEIVGAGSTFVEVSGKQMANIEMMMPKTISEQKVIGAYFAKLDHLITLHQRKRMLRKCFFSIDWEQRKLGKIVEVHNGKDYKHLEKGNIPVYGTGGYMLSVSESLSDTQDAIGIGRKGTIDKPYILRAPFWTVDTLFYCIPREENDLNFIFDIFQNINWRLMDESTGVPSLSKKSINNVKILVPNKKEQKQIGLYFNQLDHLITLHQCKSNFCKKNEVNAWEQCKFGELVDKYEDLVETPTDGYMRLGIRSHAKGTFYSYVEKGKELETAKMFRVAANNFIVNITFGWEHAVAITDENDAGKLVSHRFPQYQFHKGMIPKFFKYLILDESFKHHLELSSPGGAGRNRVLKLNDMLNYQMRFPSEQEQKKVANYFDTLDTLITLHQWECNINENTEGNDEKQRKPIKKLIISEGNLSLVDDMFLLHRMTFLVCNKYILLRLNVVKYKITIIIISNILYSIVSLLIIACYLIVINKQLIILIYVEISVVIIKGDDDYARIRS